MGQDPDSAIQEFRKEHPDTYDTDIYLLSWLVHDQEEMVARSGDVSTPVFKDDGFAAKLRELEQEPPVQAKDLDEAAVIRRNNLDWIIESVDRPEPLPPAMQGRILKHADIARADAWRPKKRY